MSQGMRFSREVTPMDSVASAPTSIVETVVSETFSTWASRKGQSITPTANPDNDSLPNLIEYVLDRSPTVPDPASLIEVTAASITEPAKWNPDLAAYPPWANVWVDYSTNLHTWQRAIDDPASGYWLTPSPVARAFFRVTAQPLPEPPLTVNPNAVGPATP